MCGQSVHRIETMLAGLCVEEIYTPLHGQSCPWENSNDRIFGFALADSMFNGDVDIRRQSLTVDAVKAKIPAGVASLCNPSHSATIAAMRSRFGIDVEIPQTPPRVSLNSGDSVIVMGVRGLP